MADNFAGGLIGGLIVLDIAEHIHRNRQRKLNKKHHPKEWAWRL